MSDSPTLIVVDLTPVLPGGENGGAKIFVLELILKLAQLEPTTQFILLTQAAAHEELIHMERKNITRLMVVGSTELKRRSIRSLAVLLKLLPHLPNRLRRLAYSVNTKLKRKDTIHLLRDLKADLLFCPFTAPTYFEPGIPTVCTIYDLQYKTFPEFFTPEDLAHREFTFKDACHRATILTAISEYSRQSAITHGGLNPEDIQTIHLQMAQRINSKSQKNCEILKRFNLKPQEYLLYPANFWKHKNHEMLLTAFGMASKTLNPGIKLVCTGAPSTRQSWLKKAATTMGLAEQVIFTDFISNNDLESLLAHCAGVVFPSLYEGFGLPIIEAMAAGVPVACSNVASLPEIAGNAAILFNPRVPTEIAEAMLSLVYDKAKTQHLKEVGLKHATLFSDSTKMAKEYWTVFQKALTKEKKDMLTGAHEDGWAGTQMNIQIAPSNSKQTLEIEVSAPEWLPQSKVIINAIRCGKKEGDSVEVAAGGKALLTLPLPSDGGHYEIQMAPTFKPSQSGHNAEDQRELSLMIQRCGILRENGVYVELFSNRASA